MCGDSRYDQMEVEERLEAELADERDRREKADRARADAETARDKLREAMEYAWNRLHLKDVDGWIYEARRVLRRALDEVGR